MKKFGKIGKVISGLEFDKGIAALIGALGALGSLIFAAISSARNLGEDNEPVENAQDCDLLNHNQTEAEEAQETVEEPNEAPGSDEK